MNTPTQQEEEFHQVGTCFPNNNSKHIDYVICYRETFDENEEFNQKAKSARQAFFDKLKAEGVEIYYLEEKESDETVIYALIHCSLDRLLIEAEAINLEMPLKDVRNYVFFTLQQIIKINMV